MDPIGAWVGAALSFLFGALTALLGRRWGFSDALELQEREHRRREAALRRALIAEVRENMRRLGGPSPEETPGAPIVRDAWAAARSLPLSPEALGTVAAAYAAAEQVGRAVELVYARAFTRGIVLDRAREMELHEKASKILRQDAGVAWGLFRDALRALDEPLIPIGAPVVRSGTEEDLLRRPQQGSPGGDL